MGYTDTVALHTLQMSHAHEKLEPFASRQRGENAILGFYVFDSQENIHVNARHKAMRGVSAVCYSQSCQPLAVLWVSKFSFELVKFEFLDRFQEPSLA